MANDFLIVGLDEVGRGCLAGPVVAGAVILGKPIVGLMDSKKLNKVKRQKLDIIIRRDAIAFGIGITSIEDVNMHGLTWSISHAMKNALNSINIKFDKIIIDGNYNFLPKESNVELIIKADNTIPAVSAASIIAKTHRDNLMINLSKEFPEYGFEKHVGYGTKLHFEMINKYGPCIQHRMFYKPLARYVV